MQFKKNMRDLGSVKKRAGLAACQAWPLLLLLLTSARAQQPVSPAPTNSTATNVLGLSAGSPTAAETNSVAQLIAEADHGNAVAQCQLGDCYRLGQGVRQDWVRAVEWYRKAAEQGNADAQYKVGLSYSNGTGVATNAAEGLKWYRKAAEQGNAPAQNMVAAIYDMGLGVPQDYVEAVKWSRKAADQGSADAQAALGYMYSLGEGVPQDYVEAYKWDNLAAAKGNTAAITNRNSLLSVMTPDQIAQAQRLSRESVPHAPPTADDSVSPGIPTASGTGFFITDDGYLISNYHVVKDAEQVRLLTGAREISARVVSVDAANDLALLKAEGKFSPLAIATSRLVKLGGTVTTVGFPDLGLQGFAPKLAKGEIAALSGSLDDPRNFQISVPVQPGNSGGALVDERGNVIGIVSAKLDAATALAASGALPENVNYAIKSSFLLGFLESTPDVSSKLKEPNTKDLKFEDVVKETENATVLVLVY